MNTSSGWLAFVRARDHPLSNQSIGHRIKPCRTPIFALPPEDVVARRPEAKRIAVSGTPLSVRLRAAHICLIKPVRQRCRGNYSASEIQPLSAGRSRCCRDAAMIAGVRPRIQTVAVGDEMTSAAIPDPGGTIIVLFSLHEVTVPERLYI